ncbi:MAG: SidA/IucD/PvdA family monooxygenase [Streptosporangiales bacterium]|nr:SidA/IucD/PvdA family monooxygenase [Streptosporangiales bacterium]
MTRDPEPHRNLSVADPRILAAATALVSGDREVLAAIDAYLDQPPGERRAYVLADDQDGLVARAATLFDEHGWRRPATTRLSAAELRRVMQLVTAPRVGDDYLAKFRHDLGLDEPATVASDTRWDARIDVVVIGAGLSGLAMATRLDELNADYTILEKHEDVGGVWFENTYPGCGLDTHPHVYTWSFAPKNDWPSYYVKRHEMLGYLKDYATNRGLRERVRFGTEVQGAWYDEEQQRWHVHAVDSASGAAREYTVKVLITAVGTLNQPKPPDIPGLDAFAGEVFHTARWRHDVALEGKRIALIGNGSSGVQVAKALAELGEVTVFQRSPAWIKPRRVKAVDEQIAPELIWLLDELPYYGQLYRFALYWEYGDRMHPYLIKDPAWSGRGTNEASEQLRADLEKYIWEQTGGDAELAAKVTPQYPPYVKRMVIDNDWYKTLTKPNVTLVADRIVAADESGLRTADGGHHRADVIVVGTGFQAAKFLFPMEVRGRSGRTPGEIAGSSDDARAYLGITLPDFPNLFAIQGPNSSIGHGGGATFVGETQSHYVAEALKLMNAESIAEIECRQATCDAYNAELDKAMEQMVWTEEGVNSRYKNSTGRIVANHPWTLQQYWNMTRKPELDDFHVVRQRQALP